MTFHHRVKAITEFGFNERQARFLATVMLHSGVCVPRQFAQFAGTAYGHNVNRFFDRLVAIGYATACACRHNRGRLYHVRHHALYAAINQPDSRHRKPVSARLAIDRLMLLDGVLASPELTWLTDESEKVAFFAEAAPSLSRDALPHAATDIPERVRLFPDRLPIGVSPTGTPVFVYLVTPQSDDAFRTFVQRHSELLRALPEWSLRLFVAPELQRLSASLEALARYELTGRLSPLALTELKWYFAACKDTSDHRARERADPRFAHARDTFRRPRWRELYRRWLDDGDGVFDLLTSTTIDDAFKRGTARVETLALPHTYQHLSPLVATRQRQRGVEEGDRSSTRSQPSRAVAACVENINEYRRPSGAVGAQAPMSATVGEQQVADARAAS